MASVPISKARVSVSERLGWDVMRQDGYVSIRRGLLASLWYHRQMESTATVTAGAGQAGQQTFEGFSIYVGIWIRQAARKMMDGTVVDGKLWQVVSKEAKFSSKTSLVT